MLIRGVHRIRSKGGGVERSSLLPVSVGVIVLRSYSDLLVNCPDCLLNRSINGDLPKGIRLGVLIGEVDVFNGKVFKIERVLVDISVVLLGPAIEPVKVF